MKGKNFWTTRLQGFPDKMQHQSKQLKRSIQLRHEF